MKLIICIIQDDDKDPVREGLTKAGFRVTVLPSTGAFFRRGNTTFLIGVDDERVEEAIETIKAHSSEPPRKDMKRATLFVMNVDRFEQV